MFTLKTEKNLKTVLIYLSFFVIIKGAHALETYPAIDGEQVGDNLPSEFQVAAPQVVSEGPPNLEVTRMAGKSAVASEKPTSAKGIKSKSSVESPGPVAAENKRLKRELEDLQRKYSELVQRSRKQPIPVQIPTELNRFVYDPVPARNVTEVVQRLQKIEELIIHHGRAYDYRSHTSRELDTLLQTLNQGAE